MTPVLGIYADHSGVRSGAHVRPDYRTSAQARFGLSGFCTGPALSAGRPVVSDFDWSPMIGDRTVKR